MEKMKKYSEEFGFKLERFMTGCDSLEEINAWDKDSLGEMDVYYTNELVSIVIRLIASDGQFSGGEAQFLNDVFGFECTPNELEEIFENCSESLESMFEPGAENGISLMKNVSEKLAEAYKELVGLVCDIIIESDGVVANSETALAAKIRELIK